MSESSAGEVQLWRICLRDELLVQRSDIRSQYSDFADDEAARDWWLDNLVGYGRHQRDDYVAELVPGPMRRALADDRARRLKLHEAAQAQRQAERVAAEGRRQ